MNNINDKTAFIELVLEKSAEIILNKSFQEFEISLLVQEISYSRSKVYNYFGGKKDLVQLLLHDSLHHMKSFILHNLEPELDFTLVISQIIRLRSQFINSKLILKKYQEERLTFGRQLLVSDLLFQEEEDDILIEIIIEYYNIDKGATTSLGFDFNQIWTYLFTYDTRDTLGMSIDDIETNVKSICFNVNK